MGLVNLAEDRLRSKRESCRGSRRRSVARRPPLTRQRGPETVERDEIAREQILPRRLVRLRMIEPAGQLLKGRLVNLTRPTTAKIAANHLRFSPQRSQRPHEIVTGKPAILPIRDRLARGKTVQVDGDVDLVVVMMVEPIGEDRLPVPDPQRIKVAGIADPPLSPRKNDYRENATGSCTRSCRSPRRRRFRCGGFPAHD
jgi:hypothetical protein